VSLVLAGGALWFAKRSVEEAAETAEAAQKTADLAAETAERQRREHEAFLDLQNRRPELEPLLEVASLETLENGKTVAIIDWGALNTGTKTADQAIMVLLVGKSVKIERCGADGANRQAVEPILQDHIVSVNDQSLAAHSWNEDSDLRPNVKDIRTAALTFEEPGTYEVRVLIQHPEIENGSVTKSEFLLIPKKART